MRFFLFCLLFVFYQVFSFSQSAPPSVYIGSDAPIWMKMFQEPSPNINKIKQAYKTYYATNPFVKNTYTQHFKRYMRWARPYTQSDGFIKKPTVRELESREESIRNIRNSSNRSMGWTMLGPFKTYDLDGTTKVTWQTNIYSLDVSLSDANVLFAGGETGGLWKTTNKGLQWTLTSANILHSSFTAVKIHPSNPNIVYAGTGGKIIKTTDGGNTWTTVYSESGLNTNEMVISTTDPNIIVAGTDSGMIRSINGGLTWTKLFSAQTWTIQRKVGSGTTFYAVRDNGSSFDFIISTNSGATWAVSNSGLWTPGNGESMDGAIIATCPTNPNKLYAYIIGYGGTLNGYVGVYVSMNGGSSWINTNPNGLVGGNYSIPTHTNLMSSNGSTGFTQGFYDMAIVVNPNNENELIAGGTSWFKSTDGGTSWNALGSYVGGLPWSHPDMQWIVASGNDLYIATDGGLNYSSNFGQSIEARMDGIGGADLWGFGSGWNTDLLVGGRYHNGNMTYHESFPSGHFYRMGGAEAPTGYVNPGPGQKVYHSDIGGHKINPGFGTGRTDFSVGAWPNESYAYYANSEMVFHPNYYNTVFIGTDNTIKKSLDGGTSFTNLYTFPGTTTNEVYEIEISRSNPDRMYCSQWDGIDDKLWRSNDGGVTWIATTPLPLPNNNDRVKMDVSATNPDILWVAVTYGSNGKKIYKSIDGGVTWTNLTTSILNGITIQDIMAQHGTNGGIYLGTNAGVFYRNNTHIDWQSYSTGLPLSIETNRLKPFYRDSKIRLGAWGFGVSEAALFEPSGIQAMPTVANKEVACTRDTVYFDDYSVLNHQGATWNWSFPGASYVSNTNIRNPKVLYSSNGTYSVSLSITNSLGQTDSKAISNMIFVNNRCAVDTIPGKALKVSDTNKHGYVDNANLTNVTHMTVTAWVKLSGIQPDYSGIFITDGSSTAGFNLKDGNNKLAYHWPNGQWWWNSNIIVPSEQWAFVAMVKTPTGITLYCNEQTSTHSIPLPAIDIPAFRIGSYRDWSSRNMNALIDEVAIYNRSLSANEIRELRHLTKKPQAEVNLVAYYQFNDQSLSSDFDKVGSRHVVLTGGATKEVSTAPIGGGSSQRINVITGGLKDFSNADVSMYFPSSGPYPNGDIVVSKINQLPDVSPVVSGLPNCYWIINNYGTNQTFNMLDSIRFYRSGNISAGCETDDYFNYKRLVNGEGNVWGNFIDLSEYYNPTLPLPFMTFKANNNITSAGQYFIQRNGRLNLNAVEICNGIDDNCNGLIDETYSLLVSSNADDGANSLRAIIQCAQLGDTIRFAASIDTIILLTPLILNKQVVLQDQIGNAVVIKANLNSPGFLTATSAIKILPLGDMFCEQIKFFQLNNTQSKVCIMNEGKLKFKNVTMTGNPKSIIKNQIGSTFETIGLVKIE